MTTIQPTPASTFAPAYATPPVYATAERIESYCADIRRASRRRIRAELRRGSAALAFLAAVEATELELRTRGHGSVRIPATEAFIRLSWGGQS